VKNAILDALFDPLAVGVELNVIRSDTCSPFARGGTVKCGTSIAGDDSLDSLKFEPERTADNNLHGSTPSLASVIPTMSPFESPLKLTKRLQPKMTNSPVLVAEEDCAIMMIEIVGFSKLTTSLVQRGSSGTDLIHGTVGRYLCQVIDIVDGFGGDLIK
jgi:hypothetical protein